MMKICAVGLLIMFTYLDRVDSTPYDRIKQQNLTHLWFEVGFVFVSDLNWATVTTNNMEWEESVSVFFSLPSFGGSHYTEGEMVAPKMQQQATKNGDNTYTFSVKLVHANDSFCNNIWTTPTYIGETQISWMVMEEGAYFLDGNSMIVGSGEISRVDDSGSATVDNGNAVRLDYPIGCEGDFSASCATTDVSSRAELGALQQLQTSINTVDDGKELFLSVRTRIINLRHIQLVLFPHSSTVPSYFEITTPEIVAYFVFASFEFVCAENMVFETSIHEGVTSAPIHVAFIHKFDYVPGLYGALGSTVSLVDATTIRSFNSTISGSHFITQEDQCVTEQSDHITAERVFTMVVGEVKGSSSSFSCNVVFNSGAVTSTPTSIPSSAPSSNPSRNPTAYPTLVPSAVPTNVPSYHPSAAETATPTESCKASEFEVKFTKTPRNR